MATITGTLGGLIRDVLTNEIPLILHRDFYAPAALAGAAIYLLLQITAISPTFNVITGMVIVVELCLAAIVWDLHLPRFKLKE